MRKMLVIAAREYNAAIRTKAFLITLLIMPILMLGGIAVQAFFRDKGGEDIKHFAVLDRTPGAVIFASLQKAVADAEAAGVSKGIQIELVTPEASSDEELDSLRERLSERVRKGALVGFLEIGPDVLTKPPGDKSAKPENRRAVIYRTNRAMEQSFPSLAREVITAKVRDERGRELGLRAEQVQSIVQPVPFETEGLTKRDPGTGAIKAAPKQEVMAAFLVPMALMVLLFMMVMMTAAPLMQGVLEEKMQRIAEVLLGSVRPFPLMLGKLVGMTGVSMTIAAVYLTGAWWAADRFGFTDYLSPTLLLWFVVFQALAVLMYGSLFIAVGAACTDMKDTQSLMWPVMMLIVIPFIAGQTALSNPNGSLATAVSLFPFGTPIMMVARLAAPPGPPWWHPVVGVVGVLLMTLVCVWAAGRIFRVGILMQGKGARFGDLARWVLRG